MCYYVMLQHQHLNQIKDYCMEQPDSSEFIQ